MAACSDASDADAFGLRRDMAALQSPGVAACSDANAFGLRLDMAAPLAAPQSHGVAASSGRAFIWIRYKQTHSSLSPFVRLELGCWPVLHLVEWSQTVARLKEEHAAAVEEQLESVARALPNGLEFRSTFRSGLGAVLAGTGAGRLGPQLSEAWKIYKAAKKDKK
eukprot:COSAG04_NODE_916_length_9432_cov_11.719383_3_plen_165_part_00